MTDTSTPTPTAAPRRHVATTNIQFGPVRFRSKVQISTAGLVAVGGLVSSILLSTAALVWVSTTPVRRHPLATRLGRR